VLNARANAVDPFGHIHELTPAGGNVDLFNTYNLNAPNAASGQNASNQAPDVIGYVRSDNTSAIIYHDVNHHVIQLKSNFGGQPPWLVTDLTVASSASVTVSTDTSFTGSAFPYVRSDACNSIVYVASDNHIHELTDFGGSLADWNLSSPAARRA
jgi:hypothetical protein